MPVPALDDFEAIFGETDDEAVKSRLAISPPKIRSSSVSKASSETNRPKVEIIGRLEDQVDYELESGEEPSTPAKKAAEEPKRTHQSKLLVQNTLESVSITPSKASEMLKNILSKRPPKLSVELPVAPVPGHNTPSVATMPEASTKTERESDSKKHEHTSSSHSKKRSTSEKTKAGSKEDSSKSRKISDNKQKSRESDGKGSSGEKEVATEEKSEVQPSESVPTGYAKQYSITFQEYFVNCRSYEKAQVAAIETKRNADTLKDGKELPVYLKAMGLYALAYSKYDLFATDPTEKWKGLLEFSHQIEKKCAGYKNDITVGLCSALIAWAHQRLIQLYLQDGQILASPAIDSLAHGGKSPATDLQIQKSATSISLALTQVVMHHERVKIAWLKAVNLVPSLSKYGFCVYSPVEDLVKTIDRYI